MPKRGENIRKRKNTRAEGRYKSVNHEGKIRHISVYPRTRQETKEKLTDRPYEAPHLCTYKPFETSFGEILKLWMKTHSLRHKAATVTKYNYLIERHILPTLGALPPAALTTLTLNDFAQSKLSCGRLDGNGGLSPAYVRGIMIVITSALQYAVSEGICPPLKTPVYKPTVAPKDLPILTPYERHRLEQYLLTDTDETKLGIYLSLQCGLRIGEICALRWSDIDLEHRIIRVRNTVARIRNETGGVALILDRPKTQASLRDVPLHSKLPPLIQKLWLRRRSPFVISQNDGFINPRTYEYRYSRILKCCGLSHYNYHSLRHTFATECIRAGVDVKTLSEILGHSSVSITLNTYVHPSREMKLEQIEKLALT